MEKFKLSGKPSRDRRKERRAHLDQNRSKAEKQSSKVIDFNKARPTSAMHIKRKFHVNMIPKNIAQEGYIDDLLNDEVRATFAIGPAGTGKTLLAVMRAIKALKDGEIQRIIISRPAVSVEEDHGFLPGDLNEKMAPWVVPIMDVFEEYWSPEEISEMLAERVIEIAPLAYMRGRTFKHCYIILDEAQNTTREQMKMFLTRMGTGSYCSVTGDLDQHDRGYTENGLKQFCELLAKATSSRVKVTSFSDKHVERDEIVEEILGLYNGVATK